MKTLLEKKREADNIVDGLDYVTTKQQKYQKKEQKLN